MTRHEFTLFCLLLPVGSAAQTSLTYQSATGLSVRSAIPTNSSSGTYFGLNTYPLPASVALPTGHTNINCDTRGWNLSTTCLGVVANYPLDSSGQPHQAGGMGGIWNVMSQVAPGSYLGQDTSAFQITNESIIPVATKQPVSGYSLMNVTNLNGQSQQVWKVTFSTPLTASQVAAIVPSMRLQTSDKFAGYTLPLGLKLNGNPLPIVDPNGTYIYSDRFDNAAGGGPYSPTPTGATLLIDENLLVEDVYSNWEINDNDTAGTAITWEAAMINDKTMTPSWSNLDPLNDSPATVGFLVYGLSDNGTGNGTIGAGYIASTSSNGTEKRGFVARNMPMTNSGPTTGFDCPFPNYCFKSEQNPASGNYVFEHQPGGSGPLSSFIDTYGNAGFNQVWASASTGTAIAVGPSGAYHFQVDAVSGSEQKGYSASHQVYDVVLSGTTVNNSNAAVLTRNGGSEIASNAALVIPLPSGSQKAIYSLEAAITCSDDNGNGALWNSKQLYTASNNSGNVSLATLGSTVGATPVSTGGSTQNWNVGLSYDGNLNSPTVFFIGAAGVTCTATAHIQEAV